jgi:hypothetical protein
MADFIPTAQEARAELARRELAKRQTSQLNTQEPGIGEQVLKYGVQNPLAALSEMGHKVANIPSSLAGLFSKEWGEKLAARPDFNAREAFGLHNKPDLAENIIGAVPEIAGAFLMPEMDLGVAGDFIGSQLPRAGKYIKSIIGNAIPQATYSAAMNGPEHAAESAAVAGGTTVPFSILNEVMQSTNPKVRMGSKILAGGLAALVGREGAKALGLGDTSANVAGLVSGALGGRGFHPTENLMKSLVEGVNPELAAKRLGAAERLGLDYLTPAEAGDNPWAAKRQGSLGRTEEGGKLLYEKGQQRQESEKNAINKTLDLIYTPEKMDKKVTEAYQKLAPVNLPQDFPLQFQDNAVIKAAERMVKNKPAYQESLKNLMPENVKLQEGESAPLPTSLVYWDHVKRALDDMVNTAERQGKNNEARIISDTRANMRNQMDEAYPEYGEARAMYERKMVRQGLEKVFDTKEINGKNFYRALASDKKFEEIVKHLKNAPEAVQNLKDMKLLFDDLLGPPTIKTAKGTEERGMNQSRSSGAFLENLMEHAFTGGGNDKAAIEFITSKDWQKQLKELNKISDKQLKMAAFALMFGKGVSQYAGQLVQK